MPAPTSPRPAPLRKARCHTPLPAVSSGGRLVVAEDAAELLTPPPATSRDEAPLVAASGRPFDLPFRVQSRLAQLEREGRLLGQAILLVTSELDPEHLRARELVAGALLSHLVAAGGGELLLASRHEEPEQRDALLALVEALLARSEQHPVTLRVQFRDPFARPSRRSEPPTSGVRASLVPLERVG